MSDFRKGEIVVIIPPKKGAQYTTLILKRSNPDKPPYFAVLEYRTNDHKVGDSPSIPITGQVDDYVNEKTGNSVTCYTTEHKVSTETSHALDLTQEPKKVDMPNVNSLSPTEIIGLAGAALTLKAVSGTSCSLDECAQSILGYSIKLMNK